MQTLQIVAGFVTGTMVGLTGVHPDIAWAKLGSLVDGARLASEQLGISTEREP